MISIDTINNWILTNCLTVSFLWCYSFSWHWCLLLVVLTSESPSSPPSCIHMTHDKTFPSAPNMSTGHLTKSDAMHAVITVVWLTTTFSFASVGGGWQGQGYRPTIPNKQYCGHIVGLLLTRAGDKTARTTPQLPHLKTPSISKQSLTTNLLRENSTKVVFSKITQNLTYASCCFSSHPKNITHLVSLLTYVICHTN